ncbi:hypothetical protein HDU67_000518 [Dinochytrium kinnereticum]|nr:hypothetical protein HDU67_000518 [Dinochytrium kinnereticum]
MWKENDEEWKPTLVVISGAMDPRIWNVDKVLEWLRLGGFSEEVVGFFKDHNVTGERLLDLTDEDMRNELGITSLEVRGSLRAVIGRLYARTSRMAMPPPYE